MMSAVESPDLLPLIEPHPELVAVMRPGPREVTEAAAVAGWLPDFEDRFRPAVAG
jgi:hypothetical protein